MPTEKQEKDTVSKETKPCTTENRPQNIFQRMLAATAEINRVAKNLKVDVTKTSSYKAVAEADVLDAVKPVEEKHGIYSYPVIRNIIKDEVLTTQSTWEGKTTEKNTFFMRVETIYRFVNIENPADYIDITTYGDGMDTQDKAPGKAMTYADKYALLKAYKIQTGDDPDASVSGDFKKPAKKDTKTKEEVEAEEKLNKAIQEVVSIGSKVKVAGHPVETIYDIVSRHNDGNKSPSKITTLEACSAIMKEFNALLSKPTAPSTEEKNQ